MFQIAIHKNVHIVYITSQKCPLDVSCVNLNMAMAPYRYTLKGVPFLNIEGGSEVPLLNFRGVLGPTFKLWWGFRGPGSLVPLLHHAIKFRWKNSVKPYKISYCNVSLVFNFGRFIGKCLEKKIIFRKIALSN